jgi:hypothetical protein
MLRKWADEFIKWFEEVKTDSKRPLDDHWDVDSKEMEKSIWIRAENPKEPYSIHVRISSGFASLIVFTGFETAVMDPQKRLDFYRKLLILNDKWKMVKFTLGEKGDDIILKTDLNLKSLNRGEFSDALSVTMIGMSEMISELGFEETYSHAQMIHVAEIIKSRDKNGESIEQIAKYLMDTFGVSREAAINTISHIIPKHERKSHDHPGYMYH